MGHYLGKAGDLVAGRYLVKSEAGQGTFGKVFLCTDTQAKSDTERTVAVKVVRSIARYVDSARIEAGLLRDVRDRDPDGRSLVVKLIDARSWGKHYIMVFEPLGATLYDYVKRNQHRPLPLFVVQQLADQIIHAVCFMHLMRLAHTDLKLENVCFTSRDPFRMKKECTSRSDKDNVLVPASTGVRLIDLGSATYDWDHKASVVNTRQYRAPEVMLGLGWSLPADMWSVGCIIMELYTGEYLFPAHERQEHFAMMERTLGKLPARMLRKRAASVAHSFQRDGSVVYPRGHDRHSRRAVRAQKRLSAFIRPQDTVFLDLVRQLLTYDPADRITAQEALNHPFFTAVRGVRPVPFPLPRKPSSRRGARSHSPCRTRSRSFTPPKRTTAPPSPARRSASHSPPPPARAEPKSSSPPRPPQAADARPTDSAEPGSATASARASSPAGDRQKQGAPSRALRASSSSSSL